MTVSKNYLRRQTAILTCIFLLLSLFIHAQNKDSILKVIPTVKDEQERIRLVYLVIGNSGNNDPEKALLYYKKGIQLARQINDKVLESVVTSEMGYAFNFMGNTIKGTETVLQGLHMAEKENNQQAIGIAYDNLGMAYDDPVKERDIIFKALTASTAAKDYVFMCWEYANLSGIYGKLNKPDSVDYYVQRQYELAMSQKVKERIPGALISMAWLCYRRGQKELALEYLRSAEREPYIAKDAQTAGSLYGSLSGYFYSQKQIDSSRFYALKAYDATKNAFYMIQMPSVALLSGFYSITHQSDSALKYLRQYLKMKDSLYNTTKRVQVAYQIMAEEERQHSLNEERKNYLQYTAVAAGIVVLLICFFLFSHSIIANQKYIRFLGVLSLLIVFEFLNLLLHPFLEKFTHHETIFMLAIMVGIAALLIPLHHKLEHWITNKMVEKNKKIRLASAKKTIQQLEDNI